MSVAGLSGDNAELVGISGVDEKPAVLDTTASHNEQTQQMARNTSRAR